MKKTLTLIVLSALATSAFAKVTYADVEASMAYQDQQNSHLSQEIQGVQEGEKPSAVTSSGEGVWVYRSSAPANVSVVSISRVGSNCALKGAWALYQGESCSGQGSKHYECHDVSSYYECQ
ncbi:hypothetical protein [Vibrio chagasii]|uniref:hypothetical protein n=1 Tax=Vibrio chagasii TaxID=170679 RepID=UPI002284FB7E|nr:hypothetical protein [Vibrio chagasii]MCY9828824.1 hypothetical protein [Vibrio chagasii]